MSDGIINDFVDDCELEHQQALTDFHRARRAISFIKLGLGEVANRREKVLSEFDVAEKTLRSDLVDYEKRLNEASSKLNKIQQRSVNTL